MEKTDKLYLINAKLNEIKESVQMYRENENMYCYFNKVLEHLDGCAGRNARTSTLEASGRPAGRYDMVGRLQS